MEKEAEEERRRKRREKDRRRWTDARERYDAQWKELLGGAEAEGPEKPLRFMDIPWPVFLPGVDLSVDLEAITADAVSTFLLPPEHFARTVDATLKKEKREKLREAMLRFHPDKFEGRILSRVVQKDHEKTKAAVAKVAITLNSLMATGES